MLDQYESFDVTPTIGREYPKLNLKELLEAPNSDELIRDLAITSMLALSCRSSVLTHTKSPREVSYSSASRMS